MIIEQNDVELISIKTKSLQDLDNEMNFSETTLKENNSNSNISFSNHFERFSERTLDTESEFPVELEADKEIDNDHNESSVRFIKIDKSPNGACGFHLTRTKWDPYPWVSAVDDFTPAAKSDLKAGDCVLEVNGCDVLGLRITEIAKLVKSSQHQVTLLLWGTNCNTKCDEESLCAAPMPRSLQRLSLVVQAILSLIECPVCLDTITPPAMQCQNGHLLCVNCRIRAEKCPVCRDRYYPRPALIAEQIHSTITSAFNLCRNEDKVRQKIFGRHNRQRQMVKKTLECIARNKKHQAINNNKSLNAGTRTVDVATAFSTTFSKSTPIINRTCDRRETDKSFTSKSVSRTSGNRITSNKFLTKFSNSKAYSMENLTNGHNNNATATTTNNIFNTYHSTITSAISQPQLFFMQEQQQHTLPKQAGEQRALFKDLASAVHRQQQQHNPTFSLTSTNQFNVFPKKFQRNHQHDYLLTQKQRLLNGIENDLIINSSPCCQKMPNNKLKHFLTSSAIDLTRSKENVKCVLESTNLFKNSKEKRPCTPAVCETSFATIPRGIKLKEQQQHYHPHHHHHDYCIQQAMCQNDVQSAKDTSSVLATNLLKLHSSSVTSLNFSFTMPSSATTPSCNCSCCCFCCCSICCSALSFSSVTQNCQSSLSASTASD